MTATPDRPLVGGALDGHERPGRAAAVHTPPAASRGTIVLLPGRGEHPGLYGRFGARLAADGYTVIALPDDRSVRAAFDAHPDGARILLGSDTGALHAWRHALDGDAAPDALVLAGLPLGAGAADRATGGADRRGREAELDLRTSCPVHRALLADDHGFAWGALDGALPDRPAALPDVPTLLLHGAADRVAPLAAVQELARATPQATLAVVEGGVHDVLNDRFHRSVAARLVLFVEEVGKGSVIRDDTGSAAAPTPARTRSRRSGPLHVSARLDYALRAVAELPADPEAEPMRCETVARARGIPLNSLVNLMVDLRRAGLVRSRRGCEGGYWLAVPPAGITVADVVRAIEGEIASVPDSPVWAELGRTVTDFLEHRTLESS